MANRRQRFTIVQIVRRSLRRVEGVLIWLARSVNIIGVGLVGYREGTGSTKCRFWATKLEYFANSSMDLLTNTIGENINVVRYRSESFSHFWVGSFSLLLSYYTWYSQLPSNYVVSWVISHTEVIQFVVFRAGISALGSQKSYWFQ